jgi:hypothetical protein
MPFDYYFFEGFSYSRGLETRLGLVEEHGNLVGFNTV